MSSAAKLESLQFVAAMLRELRKQTDEEPLLNYLIDMATVEADERAKVLWSEHRRTVRDC